MTAGRVAGTPQSGRNAAMNSASPPQQWVANWPCQVLNEGRRPVAIAGAAAAGSERADPLGQARNLAGCRIPMQHALADAAVQLGLRGLQSGLGIGLLAGGDRRLDALHRRFDGAGAGTVDRGALDGLTQALFRRLVMSHGVKSGFT